MTSSLQIQPQSSASERSRQALSALRRRTLTVNFWRVMIAVIVLGGWEIGSRANPHEAFFWSMPSKIAEQVWTWMTEGTSQGSLWAQIGVTMEETVIGFLLGAVGGIIGGILLGRNRMLADIFSVYIKIANSIPRVVLGSIFIIVLGLGLASKIALAFVMVFFVVFGNAFQGVREADRNLIANARILGASPRQVTTSVVIPSALSWITASLHVSFGFALVGAVVGEFLGSRQGIGLLIATAQGSFNAAGVFASMFILAVVALAAEGLITLLENAVLKWRPTTSHE